MQFARARKKRLPVFDASKKVVRKLKLGWRACLWGAFFIVLTIGLAYLLFWSPFLKIKKIEIESDSLNNQIKVQAAIKDILAQKIWRFVPGDSFFVISAQVIEEKIEKTFPDIENVSVRADILQGLSVSLANRQAAAIWCQGQKKVLVASSSPSVAVPLLENGSTTLSQETIFWQLPEVTQCFFVDKDGFIFNSAPEISGTILPTFYDQTERALGLGETACASSTIEFVSLAQETMKDDDVNFQGFLINNINNPDIIALTSEGWQIYFNLDRPAGAPLKVLETLLRGELSEKRISLKYIDLRTANRVYYK